MIFRHQGALNIQKGFSGAVYLFITPPSLSDLEARLRGRGSETPESLEKRLERAATEIGLSDHYDHIIINNTVEEAVSGFLKLMDREAERPVDFREIENPGGGRDSPMGGAVLGAGDLGQTRDLGQTMESDSQTRVIASLEPKVQRALRTELEALIRERIERVLQNDLEKIFEETLREFDNS